MLVLIYWKDNAWITFIATGKNFYAFKNKDYKKAFFWKKYAEDIDDKFLEDYCNANN